MKQASKWLRGHLLLLSPTLSLLPLLRNFQPHSYPSPCSRLIMQSAGSAYRPYVVMPEILSTLSDAGLVILTLNTGVALYRSRGDPWKASFVVFAYANLLLLLYCLRALERVPPGNLPKKGKLRRAVLLLATTLNIAFAHHVSKLLPPPLTPVVWCLAGSVATSGFYVFHFLPQH